MIGLFHVTGDDILELRYDHLRELIGLLCEADYRAAKLRTRGNTVQDILHGRKRAPVIKQAVRDEFPLRNFLVCPRCGKMITASISKGRSGYYKYYHCMSPCGWRYKAEIVHDIFIGELKKYKLSPGMIDLYKNVILSIYNQKQGRRQSDKKAC